MLAIDHVVSAKIPCCSPDSIQLSVCRAWACSCPSPLFTLTLLSNELDPGNEKWVWSKIIPKVPLEYLWWLVSLELAKPVSHIESGTTNYYTGVITLFFLLDSTKKIANILFTVIAHSCIINNGQKGHSSVRRQTIIHKLYLSIVYSCSNLPCSETLSLLLALLLLI